MTTISAVVEARCSPRVASHHAEAVGAALAPVPPLEPVAMIQFVAPDGSVTNSGAVHDLDPELAGSLYREMVLARALDREAVALQRQGQLGLWLQCLGQEAAQVGSVRGLEPTDMIFPSYREHAVALSRGITARELLAQWRGAVHAGWIADERRIQFCSLVLGAQTLHAVGYAMGSKMAGDDTIVAVYFGDGAASEGDVSEAFNWAAALDLPVLFICQNNQWAISTPTVKQYGEPVHRRATGFGVRSWLVDGNDAMAVHAVTEKAAMWVRSGRGPALVEAYTFRMGGHSTSDDPKRYRSESETEKWKARDPLVRLERFLRTQAVRDDWFDTVDQEAEAFATQVREQCKSIEPPDLGDMFENVYAAPHHQLAAEKRECLELRALIASLESSA